MGLIKTYKDLEIWQKGMDLTVMVYEFSSALPSEEKYGLVSQMRRSAISFPSNIAEGSTRSSVKEFIHFLNIALGSLAELETQLIICKRLKFKTPDSLIKQIEEIRKKNLNYIKYLKSR
jgi:four helix bundle protein